MRTAIMCAALALTGALMAALAWVRPCRRADATSAEPSFAGIRLVEAGRQQRRIPANEGGLHVANA